MDRFFSSQPFGFLFSECDLRLQNSTKLLLMQGDFQLKLWKLSFEQFQFDPFIQALAEKMGASNSRNITVEISIEK